MTNLDATPTDYFEQQLRSAIEDGSVFEEGWSINLRRYGMGSANNPALHTTIEIHGPDQETPFYASIDTFTYVGEETSLVSEFMSKANPYQTGLEMRLAVDMERDESNWVARDENMVEDHVIATGSGIDVLSQFAKLVEQAQEFNHAAPNYALLSHSDNEISFDWKNGFTFEEHANSNSAPMALIKKVYGEETAGLYDEVEGNFRTAPGIRDDLSSLFAIDEAGYFEALPEAANGAIADPDSEAFSVLVKMVESLHPDSINEKGADHTPAPVVATDLKF